MVDNLKQGTFSQRKCDCGKTTTKIIVFSLKMARFGKDTRVIFVSAWNTSRDSCANSQHKDVDDIRLHLFPPNELMAFMSQEPLNVPALGPRPVWSWIFWCHSLHFTKKKWRVEPPIKISVEWKLWKGKTNQGWRNKYHIFIVDIRLALNVPALGPRPVLSCILTS